MNRTVAEYRAARAVELSLQGLTYDQVAAELGFANRSGAWKAVRRCLSRRQDLAAELYVATSLVDLDLIQERAWPRAMRGDLDAGHVVLRAIEDRVRLAEVLSPADTQDGKRAEPPAVATPASPKRRSAREPETGFFHSLDV